MFSVYVCVRLSVSVFVCVYGCICVYVGGQRDRKAEEVDGEWKVYISASGPHGYNTSLVPEIL